MKFVDILDEYNIPHGPEGHQHIRPGWIGIDCPFHLRGKGSHKWHLGYSQEGGFLNCWVCGPHSLLETIIELTELSRRKAYQLIRELDIAPVIYERPKGKLILPNRIDRLSKTHADFLCSRGLSAESLIKRWHIKGLAIAGRLSWRIFIPIHYHAEIVSWTTRAVSGDVKRRYISASLNEEAIPHKSLLYGMDYARDTIIIVEGPLDVWSIGPGAVATFGTAYSTAQIEKMVRFPVRYVCFDNQPDARQQAKKLCDCLSVFDGETHNIELSCKDAGCASKKELEQLRKLVR